LNKIIFILIAVASAIGSFLIWSHGNAKYDAGVKSCKASFAQSQSVAAAQTQKTAEKVRHEVKKIKSPDLDNALADAGWLRENADR